jgi:hypothetical protein
MAKVAKKPKAARPAAKKSAPVKAKKAVKTVKTVKAAKAVKAVKTVKETKATISKATSGLNFNQLIKDASVSATKQTETLKKSIVDLKAKLTKATAKQKTQKDKRATITNKFKTSPSAATKNQLNKAKEEYTVTTDLVASLKTQFEAAKKTLQTAQTEQAKLSALQKLLVSFEKDWSAAQKKKSAAPEVTTKAVASSAPKKAEKPSKAKSVKSAASKEKSTASSKPTSRKKKEGVATPLTAVQTPVDAIATESLQEDIAAEV